jgi:hypothetical protein
VNNPKVEMNRLMQEHIESLGNQTFVAPNEEQLQQEERRLTRIRELSADYLKAFAGSHIAAM